MTNYSETLTDTQEMKEHWPLAEASCFSLLIIVSNSAAPPMFTCPRPSLTLGSLDSLPLLLQLLLQGSHGYLALVQTSLREKERRRLTVKERAVDREAFGTNRRRRRKRCRVTVSRSAEQSIIHRLYL